MNIEQCLYNYYVGGIVCIEIGIVMYIVWKRLVGGEKHGVQNFCLKKYEALQYDCQVLNILYKNYFTIQ